MVDERTMEEREREGYREPGDVLAVVRRTDAYHELALKRAEDSITREEFMKGVGVLCAAFKKEKGITKAGW